MAQKEETAVETQRLTAHEIFDAAHAVSFGQYLHWLGPATLGNIVGGVFIVSVLNYGQVRQE